MQPKNDRSLLGEYDVIASSLIPFLTVHVHFQVLEEARTTEALSFYRPPHSCDFHLEPFSTIIL